MVTGLIAGTAILFPTVSRGAVGARNGSATKRKTDPGRRAQVPVVAADRGPEVLAPEDLGRAVLGLVDPEVAAPVGAVAGAKSTNGGKTATKTARDQAAADPAQAGPGRTDPDLAAAVDQDLAPAGLANKAPVVAGQTGPDLAGPDRADQELLAQGLAPPAGPAPGEAGPEAPALADRGLVDRVVADLVAEVPARVEHAARAPAAVVRVDLALVVPDLVEPEARGLGAAAQVDRAPVDRVVEDLAAVALVAGEPAQAGPAAMGQAQAVPAQAQAPAVETEVTEMAAETASPR